MNIKILYYEDGNHVVHASTIITAVKATSIRDGCAFWPVPYSDRKVTVPTCLQCIAYLNKIPNTLKVLK